MKLAAWNVNSLKVRLPQVLDWLAVNPVDALCLYDQRQLPEPAAASASATHPELLTGGVRAANPAFRRPGDSIRYLVSRDAALNWQSIAGDDLPNLIFPKQYQFPVADKMGLCKLSACRLCCLIKRRQ